MNSRNQLATQDKSLREYFVIVYLIPIIGTLYVTIKEGLYQALAAQQPSGLAMVVILAMIHAPTIAAMIVTYRDQGWEGIKDLFRQLKDWRFKAKWYLMALLIFPLAILGALLFLSTFSKSYAPQFSFSVFVFATLLSALYEEIGWTGFAIPRLLKRWSPLKTGVLLGIIHMFWHLAADYWGSSVFYGSFLLYASHFLLWMVGLIILRVMILWMYTRTQSLVLGWLTHFSWTGGQVLMTVNLSPVETVLWNTAFVVLLLMIMVFIGITNQDFRDFWKSGVIHI